MGTWSTSTLGSDAAFDWYDFYCESDQSLKILESIFEAVLSAVSKEVQEDSYLIKYIPVAGEIVAFLNGHPCSNFPDEIYHAESGGMYDSLPFIKKEKLAIELDQTLKNKAIMALTKILEPDSPELRSSWREPSLYEDWKLEIQNLIERIKR